MRKLIYLILFYSSFAFSQISLTLKFLDRSSKVDEKQLIEIIIKNNSQINYILPIDTTDFKPFYNGESCVDFVDQESYKDLMLKANFENQSDNEILMAIPQFKLMGKIDENDNRVIMELKRRDSLKDLQNKEVDHWKRVNRILQSNDWAIKNKFLISNLIFLKPGQEFVYQKYFTPKKINSNQISGTYDYYNLLPNESYSFSLMYCIDERVYGYLTEKQKRKFKKFKFFTGSFESNTLKWK
ncbi:hypothetical protein [Chryseobacterium sp. 2987]|uniref:hypothetical protein n=1 Tax=Chryseobacterium sp. 2987 TaxID=2817767 RepID=UPI0028657802|nr:hypothetical protein [Chryseobacterium sp. 2987]MDR6922272.1 hypothetical protein [Chryseobacterium sp. 2987]